MGLHKLFFVSIFATHCLLATGMQEGFAIVTLFVGSYAELQRIWDKAYLFNRSGNYRNIALPGCICIQKTMNDYS